MNKHFSPAAPKQSPINRANYHLSILKNSRLPGIASEQREEQEKNFLSALKPVFFPLLEELKGDNVNLNALSTALLYLIPKFNNRSKTNWLDPQIMESYKQIESCQKELIEKFSPTQGSHNLAVLLDKLLGLLATQHLKSTIHSSLLNTVNSNDPKSPIERSDTPSTTASTQSRPCSPSLDSSESSIKEPIPTKPLPYTVKFGFIDDFIDELTTNSLEKNPTNTRAQSLPPLKL